MERTKGIVKQQSTNGQLKQLQRINELKSRMEFAKKVGWQYGSDRKLYEALGYPTEKDLTFQYYFDKYERQDIASAVIDRPVEATWNGTVSITEEGETPQDSTLNKAWVELNNKLKVKSRLVKLDKIAGIGQYGLLLFGFDDVKEVEDFKTPVTGKKKLLYLKQIPENAIEIFSFEKNSSKPRFGLPLLYKIKTAGIENETNKDILIHYSRVLHVLSNNVISEIYGRPRLKPIVNRLEDLEKLLGGDAEMFWRGARPGYHASAKENFEMGTDQIEALEEELDKYEHDLRRFISTQGVDIKALEQQIADPLHHIDAQLQAISAQTGIPKRILIGSERGELASTQDKDQWLSLIQTRMEEFAEPIILRPFIDKCMEHNVLPKVTNYFIHWADIFAPSEKQKAEVGKLRADALKVYSDSLFASEIFPPQLAFKFLLGLTEIQIQEVLETVDLAAIREDKSLIRDEGNEGDEGTEED